jgi:hypothetical protein
MRWLLAFIVASSPLWAADRSPPLSLERARDLVAAMGLNAGKIFADDENRYLVSRVEGRSPRPNVFLIEVEITPLPKYQGGTR